MYIRELRTKLGSSRFKCILKHKGKVYKTATFRKKTDAKAFGKRIEGELVSAKIHGKSPKSKVPKITLQELVDSYHQHQTREDRSRRSQINWWIDQLGADTYIDEITKDEIELYLDTFAAGRVQKCRAYRFGYHHRNGVYGQPGSCRDCIVRLDCK